MGQLSCGGKQSTSGSSLEDVEATVVVRGLYRGCMVLINNGGGGWKILTQTVHSPLNLYIDTQETSSIDRIIQHPLN